MSVTIPGTGRYVADGPPLPCRVTGDVGAWFVSHSTPSILENQKKSEENVVIENGKK